MTETLILVCSLCHYRIELDDVALDTEHHHVLICQRCWAEHTETTKPMPKELRQQIQQLLSEMT